MQANNIYPTQQSFSGAFRFNAKNTKAQTEIPQLFTQGRQIFKDILEQGDQVIVVRDNYDKRIGKYIAENNISDVEYFPTINTKCGLDADEPQGLLNLIKDKAIKIITNTEEMFETIKTQRKSPQKTLPAPKPKTPNPAKLNAQAKLEMVSNALRLNIEDPEINTINNLVQIIDKNKKRRIEIITQPAGQQYVYVKPDSKSEDTIKCLLNSKGDIIKSFETPDDIHKFLMKFNQLRKECTNTTCTK